MYPGAGPAPSSTRSTTEGRTISLDTPFATHNVTKMPANSPMMTNPIPINKDLSLFPLTIRLIFVLNRLPDFLNFVSR